MDGTIGEEIEDGNEPERTLQAKIKD